MNEYGFRWVVSNRMSLTVSVCALDVSSARDELEDLLGKEVADKLHWEEIRKVGGDAE